jgi:RNA polymerase sigma-70 factor (ECF subfamily)
VVAVPSKGRADLHAQAPEAGATHALYEQYGRQIYAYCYSRLRSREEAEDAVQSTFLNAFRALQRDVAPAHEAAWLYKIAENVCLTRARSSVRRRRVETPGDLEAISEIVPAHEPDAEELVNLPQALESMPEQQRHALLLREWQGLSYREIAEEMDLSQSAVETLLFRARRTLASGLAEEPKPRGRLSRLRAGGDAGAIAALLKTLIFSGGSKVVIAGAIAASSAVGVSPGARHSIDDFFVPHMKAKPAAVHDASAKPKTVVPVAPVVSHYVAPVVAHTVAPKPAKKKAQRHVVAAPPKHAKLHGGHVGRFGRIDKPLPPPTTPPAPAAAPTATVATATPLEPTPPAATTTVASQQPAPAPKPSKHHGKSDRDTPAPVAPVEPLPSDPGNGQDHRDHGRGHEKK